MGLDLRSPNVIRAGLGAKDSTGYTQSYVGTTPHDQNAQAYIMHFHFSIRLDSSKSVAPLTIRYYFADSTHADVDTVVFAYKYPYPTAEVIVPFSALQSLLGTHHLQDVD